MWSIEEVKRIRKRRELRGDNEREEVAEKMGKDKKLEI